MDSVGARLVTLAERQDAVLTRRDVLANGGTPSLVRSALHSGAWMPLLRGSYLAEPSRTGRGLQRSWARSAVLTVRGAVVAKSTAAALHGLDGAPRSGVVDVIVDREVAATRRRLAPHRFSLAARDVVDLRGIATTSVMRTLVDLVPTLERPDALAVLDSASRSGAVSAADLLHARERAAGRRGGAAVHDLWSLADARAANPLESRVRMRCLDGEVPPDDLQREIRDEHGHLLARADLAFSRRRRERALPLLLEADGVGPHGTPEAVLWDRWRANTLVALGYDIVRATWVDTTNAWAIPSMVRGAL